MAPLRERLVKSDLPKDRRGIRMNESAIRRYVRTGSWSGLGLLAIALGACGAPADVGLEDGEHVAQGEAALRVALPAPIQAEAYDRAFESTPATNSGGKC